MKANFIPPGLPLTQLTGIHTRTPDCVPEGRRLHPSPPDSIRLTTPMTRYLRGAAFPSATRPLHLEVFNICRGRYISIRNVASETFVSALKVRSKP
ncbi:MAG: hypothetical protein J07HQX50_02852 [Haloquadratum sp. J07HQX50]|nr:MAG: hypothetical protein J07HQX50_02852 [Haloquadratum sp. J07HQX50]